MTAPLNAFAVALAVAALCGCTSEDRGTSHGDAGETPAAVTYGSISAVDVSPPTGHASDSWLASGSGA